MRSSTSPSGMISISVYGSCWTISDTSCATPRILVKPLHALQKTYLNHSGADVKLYFWSLNWVAVQERVKINISRKPQYLLYSQNNG